MHVARSLLLLTFASAALGGGLDLVFEFSETTSFSAEQRAVFDPALARAEKFWEGVVQGRAGSDDTLQFPIQISSQNSGLASANAAGRVQAGDFVVSTRGTLFINPSEILPATDGLGIAPGVNVLDELLAHEIAHALGVGALWEANELAVSGSGRYTGEFGLAAFRAEFQNQENAAFIPVEIAGAADSADFHWDQLFRSSPQEGNPKDPLSLSPLLGIVDARGRDLGQEIMSAAVDPDFGEQFFSNTTVQSFRDIGYDVVNTFPLSLCDFDSNGTCDAADIDAMSLRIRDGDFSEQFDVHGDGVIDDLDRAMMIEWHLGRILGDADLNDVIDFSDFLALSANFGNAGGWAEGDFDGSGTIEFPDFLILSDSFGRSSRHEGQVSVPEPTQIELIVIAVLILLLVGACRTSVPR